MSRPRNLRLPLLALTTLVACERAESPSVVEPNTALTRRSNTPSVQFIAEREPETLATVGDVTVTLSGYGSAMARKPGSLRSFYLLTDRGPNYDGPGSPAPKRFPVPEYAPRIYPAFVLGKKLRLGEPIVLKRGGMPMNGLPVPAGTCGNTLEQAQTVLGAPISPSENGFDPEGLVAMPDGTFWISDEYGPFMAKFDADGNELLRFAPCGANPELPPVFARRRPNRGMEGLTITPDGQWLVGIMQSPLQNPNATVNATSVVTRVLFKHLTSGETRQYLYLLDRTGIQGNSEILAVSNKRFMVIERDGNFLNGTPAATQKKIYEFDITGATEVSSIGGDLQLVASLGNKTLEQASPAELMSAGIVPVTKSLVVDLLSLGYPHDKPEGLALAPGRWLFVVNDDDFAIVSDAGALGQKVLPGTSRRDASAVWQIKLP
jgi:hypothetical protein